MIDAAAADGGSIWGQVSPAPLNMEFQLLSPYPFEGLESWRIEAMSVVNQPEVYRAVLSDPAFRSKVKAEIYGEHPSGLTALLPHEDWGNMIVAHPADGDEAMTGRKHHSHLAGDSFSSDERAVACVGAVDELAREAGVDPLDWMLDYSLAHDLEPVFFMRFVQTKPSHP